MASLQRMALLGLLPVASITLSPPVAGEEQPDTADGAAAEQLEFIEFLGMAAGMEGALDAYVESDAGAAGKEEAADE